MKAASLEIEPAKSTGAVVGPQQAGAGVTLEVALYAAVFGVAALLRFLNLEAAPLSAREAAQALAALNGTAMPAGGSPLLYAVNQILFGVFGESVNDTGVRIVPAAIGTLLVLLPGLVRVQTGRYAALAASLMLALSPTMVLASRSLDGQIVVAACAFAAIAFGVRYFTAQHSLDLIGLALAIGLALTSGPGLLTAALVIAPGLLIAYRWIASGEDRMKLRELRQNAAALRTALIVGGTAFFLAATVLLLRAGALANVPESLSAWMAAWQQADVVSALRLFQILLLYESLIVCFGLLGLLSALRRITGLVVVLGLWALGALIVILLQPGRQVLDLTLVLTPLALLGGIFLEALTRQLLQDGSWKAEGVFCLVALILAAFAAVSAGNYATGLVPASNPFTGDPMNRLVSYGLGMSVVSVLTLLVFGFIIGWRATLRAALVALFVFLTAASFSSAWAVTQLRPSDPRELLWGPSATSSEVRALTEAVEAASKRKTGFLDRMPMAVTLPQDDPVVRWYLRKYPNAQYNNVVADLAPAIIAPLGSSFPPNMVEAYRGKPFAVRAQWEPSTLADGDLMKWWLYRESAQAPLPEQTLVLWLNLK
jgi:uncharacterized protein (TIGR03663 family)